MKRKDMEIWEASLMKEIVRRRALGEYNADAASINILAEALFEVLRHLKEKAPREKTLDDDNH